MFLLSMSQIRAFDHFHLNLSNLLMVAVMGLVMLVGSTRGCSSSSWPWAPSYSAPGGRSLS
ncbi:MAG: hypothetical protein ABI725_06720 [Chloroflexota bacterium]